MRPALLRLAQAALLLLALLGPATRLWAQDLQPVPALSARVVDQTGKLDAAQKQALEERLAALERAKGSQLVILIVPSTAPEDIASYANRVGNAWKIGRREVGDGVLLVVALNERKLRIEVAKTLEGAIPDLAARQIIDRAITPRFRQGDYAGGLNAGVDQLAARIQGEPLPPMEAPPARGTVGGFDLADLAIFLFVAVPVLASVTRRLFGRKLGALLSGGGMGLLAWWITASLLIAGLAAVVALLLSLFSALLPSPRPRGWGPHHGGWGSGGLGGGGGFSSGGGGDFGGGGASGDW